MRRCPITYETFTGSGPGEGRYSRQGLRRLSRSLLRLDDLPYSAEEQRREAVARATQMSVQGVQPKLSAKLLVREGRFEIVDRGGELILKPQNLLYRHLPENEDLTLRLASAAGIEVPTHGLVLSRDGSWTYFIRRFDRISRGRKLAVEDFAQLSGRTRETKYDASMEQVAAVLDRFATFPAVEKLELFTRTAFSFLTGNEDMHLKNFSLVVRGSRVQLAPAYDLVNSTIALPRATEELALPLRGKKRRLKRQDIVDYYGVERLGLQPKAVEDVLGRLARCVPEWERLVAASFLPAEIQEEYLAVLRERKDRLGL